MILSAQKREFCTHFADDFVPHEEECGGTEDNMEKWCYVNIRPGAHSFYWLYRSTHAEGWENRPLVMWLQVTFFVFKIFLLWLTKSLTVYIQIYNYI